MLRDRRTHKRGFDNRLSKDWKIPFNLLEMFIAIAYEMGDEINNEFRKDIAEYDKYTYDVLTRLHARACQISSEILILLKNGYADGAFARWRSLHEVAVVGSFIAAHGNEVAEKYLLHDVIESFKAAELYQKYSEVLGFSPIPQDEFESLRITYNDLIIRFGNPFKNDYGWASSSLGKEKPTFSDIEENTSLDHHRPYYKLASNNVHANSNGVMFKIGLLPSPQEILLAGPTNSGFTDPAQSTAISLGLITITLATMKPTIDNLVLSDILLKLESEISDEFLKVQKIIEKRNEEQLNRSHVP